ncbi:MAG: hypothetical protein QOF72_875, partial [Blastocatellia bacterium]|nr:hypothetical protein [Blastocatellia bacterium]
AGCSGTTTVTCNLAGLVAGQSKSVTIVVKPTAEGLITATSSATATEPELNTANNTATQDTHVTIGTVYTVNSSADTDDGSCAAVGTGNGCTLREAIIAANTHAGKDTIVFNIAGVGAHTINPSSTFPFIGEGLFIDGSSQPGFAGQPIIELNGSAAGQANGLYITGGSTHVKGLVINGYFYGAINLKGGNNIVEGNYIGTNLAGTAAVPNNTGVAVESGPNDLIGGVTLAARNVISGNKSEGVSISAGASGARVQGNYIGLKADGSSALSQPNFTPGVALHSAVGNIIGGTTPGAGNVISGNNGPGIFLSNTYPGGTPGSSNNVIAGNLIGTTPNGLGALINVGSGISIGSGSSNNLIGGTTATARNVIANSLNLDTNSNGNTIQGNYIGIKADGSARIISSGWAGIQIRGSSSNTIGGGVAGAGNVISGNAGPGIWIVDTCTECNPSQAFIASTNNVVQGNIIGLNPAGTAAIPNTNNGIGIERGSTGTVIGGSTASARNIISGNTGNGINITNFEVAADGNTIQGNYIGTNGAGTAAVGNNGNGIGLNGVANTIIGGTAPGAGNIVSGNLGAGITLGAASPGGVQPLVGCAGTQILGNYIGTNATGTAAIGNNSGLVINGSSNNLVGGTTAAARNVISGNTNNGLIINVSFVGSGASTVLVDATGNNVQGNYIGTNATGTAALPNTNNGVAVFGNSNTIGGTAAGSGNVIAFNNNVGISLNCVSPPAGAPASLARCSTNTAVLSNSFFSNGSIGININSLPGAPPATANLNQAAPLVSFTGAGANTTVVGSLNSTPSTQFRIEFFSNNSCDGSGSGEGQTFIGSTQATTDGAGFASLNVSSLSLVPQGKVITATATGPNGTSRFSACRLVSAATASLSGRATDQTGTGIGGVTITLSGSQGATATTNAGGNYSFPGLASSGTYTVAASLAGMTFYPASYTLTGLPGDQTVNFTKAVTKYTITDLGALLPNPFSIGWDVNNSGQVAGWSGTVTSTNEQPFFYNGVVTNLGRLASGTNAIAIAIGDSGRVVGYSELAPQGAGNAFAGQLHGFFSDNGGPLKEIGTLGGPSSQAWGVNGNGVVVGQAQLSSTQTNPFIWKDTNNNGVWDPSEMVNVGQLGTGNNGRLFAVNNLGIAVGNSNTALNGVQQATLWKDDNNNGLGDPGELRLLGSLGGTLSGQASGINETNYVVGVASTPLSSTADGRNLTHAFIWHDDNSNGVSDPGEMKDLGTLGGELSSALRINENNEVIGNSTTTGLFNASGFVYRNNFMLDLNAAIPQNSGWHVTEARGINDNGVIVGYGFQGTGNNHALLLTPSLKQSQTVTLDTVPNKTYGNAPFTVNATASSNLPVTYSISGPATINGSTVTITGAGTVTVTASQAGDDTYDSATASQTITIAKKSLSVTADGKTRLFGAPDPTFTASYFGFVNGDTAASLGGSLSFTTNALATSNVGSYSIAPAGLSSNNYSFAYLAGTLTIDQASTSTASSNYTLTVPGPVNLLAQVIADSPSTQAVNGGTVTFTIRQGATNVATITSGPVTNGQAGAGYSAGSSGAYTVYVSYSGNSNYSGSTSLASLTVGTANPVPSITGVTPDSAVKKETETGQFTLLIDGNGFMSTASGDSANSTVDWYDRTTGQHTNLGLSSTTGAQIQAVVPYTLIRDGKTIEVTVINPGPGGGASNVQPFFVTDTTATITSAETVLPDPVTGTASTTSVTPTGAVLSAEASSGGAAGTGTLTVAQYSEDPIGTNASPNTSAFSTAEGSGYFDVYVAPGSSFTSLSLDYCNTGGTTLYWWNGSVWGLVSNQTYTPSTGCITVTVTTTSSPSIAQLTGTVFGVATGPAINSIAITPSSTVALGSGAITLNASFTDAGGTGPYTAEINWGDTQTTNLSNVAGPTLTSTHTYSAAGAYTIKVKVARGSSFGTSTFSSVVVFDPNAGSMNSDGWFNSPLGAFPTNPSFAGKVHFESNAAYDKQTKLLSGKMKVDLPGMNFNGTGFAYLSITGSRIQMSGSGTINGAGSYVFLLSGIDGKVDGKKLPDKVRIKIVDSASGRIVYDGLMGAADNAAPTLVLGGGTINIKK